MIAEKISYITALKLSHYGHTNLDLSNSHVSTPSRCSRSLEGAI